MKLYEFQKEDIRKWYYDMDGRGIFAWAIGSGKGQPYGSKVLTVEGWINIESLKLGDMIYSSDGVAYPVTGVFPKQEIDTYKFSYSDKSSCVFDKDHLHIVRSLRDRYCEKKYRANRGWRVLPTTYFLDKKLIHGWNKFYDIPIIKPVKYTEKSIKIDPYVLGVLLGDGCLKSMANFTNSEPYIIEKMTKLLEEFKLSSKDNDHRITYCKHGLNPMLDHLRFYGLYGKGSHEKHIPEEYLFSEEDIRWKLLNGLMDTDGYVESGTAMITTTSEKLRDGIIELCRSLGSLPTYITKENPQYTHNNELRYGRTAYIIRLGNLYKNPFTLPRKAVLWNDNRKLNNCRYIINIEYVGKQKTVCISVDSPDHSYVTENFVVTHNTCVGSSIVKRFVNMGKQVLVVATKSLIPDWIDNLNELEVHTYNYQSKRKQELQQVSIISYDNLSKVVMEHYDFVIADEVHRAKSYNSKRGQYFREIAKKARYLLMMSGTLHQYRDASELINYLWCLDSNVIRKSIPENITRFRQYHCKEVVDNKRRFYVTLKSGADLINNLLQRHVCVRKLEDILDLPEHQIIKQKITCNFDEEELANKLSEDLNMSIDMAYEKPHIMHALQMANGINPDTKVLENREKLDALFDKVSNIPEEEQVIIWTYWKSFTKAAGEMFHVKHIDGDTSDADRKQIIDNFKSGQQRILVASMGTISEGFNLQNCHVQIFANIWYDYIKYEQCKGRIYRNGQTHRTITYLLCSRDTIEEEAMNVLNQKLTMAEANNYLKSVLLKRYGGR